MHTLQTTTGARGWYQECPQDRCRRDRATSGKSPSPGWISLQKANTCPSCGTKTVCHVSVARPAEHRVVRQGDGVVLDRFPATDAGFDKALKLIKRLKGVRP